jgi:hypothetical protein
VTNITRSLTALFDSLEKNEVEKKGLLESLEQMIKDNRVLKHGVRVLAQRQEVLNKFIDLYRIPTQNQIK